MAQFLIIIISLIILIAVIAIIWRFSSHRSSIPCPSWLGWLVELDNPLFRNNSARRIIKHAGIKSGMKVLDFGCGPGRLTIPAARRVGLTGKVTAFDIQSEMLERVRAKAQAQNLQNIQLIQGGAGERKLGNEEYDRVLLVTVLGEIPDKKTAMKEIFDSLKQGGILSITEVIADPHFLRRGSVRQIAGSAGFIEKEFFGNRISFTINFEKKTNQEKTRKHHAQTAENREL